LSCGHGKIPGKQYTLLVLAAKSEEVLTVTGTRMSPKHFRKEMVLKRGLDCFKPIAYTARQVTLIDVKD
jgi:hypothetical protein